MLKITDFEHFKNTNLPLWVTASCDIMPFDGVEDNIGESCPAQSEKGGAVAFYGTTRTVFAQQNKYMNRAFLRRVLSREGGKPLDDRRGTPAGAERPDAGQCDGYGRDRPLGKPSAVCPARRSCPVAQSADDEGGGRFHQRHSCQRTDTVPMLKAGDIARIAGHMETNVDFRGS